MKSVLVTGGNGQLAQCLRDVSQTLNKENFSFIFVDKNELDITDKNAIGSFLDSNPVDYIVNCAAYTAVDKAESDEVNAFAVNADAVGYLAEASNKIGAKFIHISTDYVFDGTAIEPIKEEEKTNPISVYGESKLKGEQLALSGNENTIIIRTAWVYSQYGANFLKTMIRLFSEKEELSIVADQYGTPTNANDLAEAIVKIIRLEKQIPGIYHFTNSGKITWFDFAEKIKELTNSNIKLSPIKTEDYPTPAKRPRYSVLNTDKIYQTFGVEIKDWEDSLRTVINGNLI